MNIFEWAEQALGRCISRRRLVITYDGSEVVIRTRKTRKPVTVAFDPVLVTIIHNSTHWGTSPFQAFAITAYKGKIFYVTGKQIKGDWAISKYTWPALDRGRTEGEYLPEGAVHTCVNRTETDDE